MIISRAPMRLSLGGGGTDLPSYYSKYGGFLVSGAINKYVYVGANHQFYNNYLLKYSKIEKVQKVQEIKHNLIREALKSLSIRPGIEITSLSDIPAKTGLGSSGAFLVSLLNTLYHYSNMSADRRSIAEAACQIELEILKEAEGKQDKYVSAFGGIRAYQFHSNGSVSVIPLRNEDTIKLVLEENLYLFYTGKIRKGSASDALKEQVTQTQSGNKKIVNFFHEIKEIGYLSKQALEKGDFDEFGSLLNQHWEIKKQYSTKSTDREINHIYKIALSKGALGGKTIGAPGGGFLMFYHSGKYKERWDFVDSLCKMGLVPISFKFDNNGVTTLIKEEK